MSKRRKPGSSKRRERRSFTEEFKQEAVRRLHERRAEGGTLAEVARELDLGENLLRGWAQRLTASDQTHAAGLIETPEQELRRLRRANAILKQEREFGKKSRGVLREGVAVRYACVARHLGEYPLRLMCRVLEVSPAGYDASRRRSPSARAMADERLMLHVRIEHAASEGTYGAPRIQRELADQGVRVSTKRVARLMRQDGVVARPRRRGVHTTDSNHPHPIAPNLLERRFDVNGVRRNQVWMSAITYVPTDQGWLDLAVVLDLSSRRVIGWSMRESLEAEGALAALRMAVERRRPPTGLIHHSDRGVQYACGTYQAELARHGMQASMSRPGDCWDNAVAESFFATLAHELIMRRHWVTRREARQAIFRYIEGWYNLKRRHSTLGYLSPAVYEAQRRAA
ncbi:MAG: IS3 family transposase [Gemmatimonadaceae bacterium]